MDNNKYNGIGNCYPFKSDYWETMDHQIIQISEMETSHIENTINFLKNHKDFYDEGGMTFWCEEQDCYYNDNSYLVDIKIDELMQELMKRRAEGRILWN